MKMKIELSDLEVLGCIIDNGYSEQNADLMADVKFRYNSRTKKIDQFEVISGTFFLIDQDGGNCGEITLENDDYNEALKIAALEVMEKINKVEVIK